MSFARDRNVKPRIQPELAVGGYSALDGTVEFYGRVRALAHSKMRVVDFGAGRGAWFEDDQSRYRRDMRLLRGSVLEVIGCDVDKAVLTNRAVDRALLIEPNARLPLDDSSVDIVVADYVFEHIANPKWLGGEFSRVIKPGGWICARTPTKYNYVSMAARIVANLHHTRLLRLVQPDRKAEDVFPTVYRLNTRKSISTYFDPALFEDYSYIYCFEPQYYFGNRIAYKVFEFVHWLLPAVFHGNLYIFLRKR